MVKLKAECTIDLFDLRSDSFKELREEWILRELTYSLSKDMMKDCEFPTPRADANDLVSYSMSFCVLTDKESREYYRNMRELKAFKEICEHYIYIVNRKLKEEDIEILLEK